MLNRKPNFFSVGAPKAGTTAIYSYLKQHPDVFLSPIKEPHFFSKDIRCKNFNLDYKKKVCFDIKKYLSKPNLETRHIAFIENEEDYLQLFRNIQYEKIIGEFSTGYLYSKVAAKEIFKFNSLSKIFIILRNPIDRAFSHWLMGLRRGNKYISFEKALELDFLKKNKGWGQTSLYIELGLYFEQVKRYLDVFPKEQVLILIYEDFKQDPLYFYKKLLNFLELDFIEVDLSLKYNEASIPKNFFIMSLIKSFKGITNSFPLTNKLRNNFKNWIYKSSDLPKLSINERKRVIKYFYDDIKNLENLLERDLSIWYQNLM